MLTVIFVVMPNVLAQHCEYGHNKKGPLGFEIDFYFAFWRRLHLSVFRPLHDSVAAPR